MSGDNTTNGIAYHITLVYTTPNGSEYISAGPGISNYSLKFNLPLTAIAVSSAEKSMETNEPSAWGKLVVNGSGTFTPGRVEDGVDVVPPVNKDSRIPNADAGRKYDSEILSANATLTQWESIKKTFNDIANLGLTYSPTAQNSNSVACTALSIAGVPAPTAVKSIIAYGCRTNVPTTPAALKKYLDETKMVNEVKNAVNPNPYSLTMDTSNPYYNIQTLDWTDVNQIDTMTIFSKTGSVIIQQSTRDDFNSVLVAADTNLTVSNADIYFATDGLNVDVMGDNNLMEGGSGLDIDVFGDYNTLYVDNSHIDFFGNYGDVFGGGNWGSGGGGINWHVSQCLTGTGDTSRLFGKMPHQQEMETDASATAGKNSGKVTVDLTNPAKLVETMAMFAPKHAALTNRPAHATAAWATIAAQQ